MAKRPTIGGFRAEIKELKARVLEADQCAARALEGRDMLAKECIEWETTAKVGPRTIPDPRYPKILDKNAELEIELRIARLEVKLMKLKLIDKSG